MRTILELAVPMSYKLMTMSIYITPKLSIVRMRFFGMPLPRPAGRRLRLTRRRTCVSSGYRYLSPLPYLQWRLDHRHDRRD
jgi:hypothetical protein